MEYPANSFTNPPGDIPSINDPILPSIFVQIPMAYQPPTCSASAIKAEESIKSEVMEMGQRKAQSPFLLGNEEMVTARVKPLKVHKCKQCSFLTISPANLTAHTESHRETTTLDEVLTFTCPGCPNTFRAKESLEVHLLHDHQILEAELEALIEFAQTKSPPNSNRSTPKARPSRIFIKSVDVLRNPVDEGFLQNRIFLKNVNVLRNPEQIVLGGEEILQPAVEQLCDSASEFPSTNNPGIVVTEALNFGLPGMFGNDCTPSPIDLDRGELIVITPSSISESVHSSTADHSDNTAQEEPGRIYLRNADTMKTLGESNAFLHLRTVDELNLMNLEDVQGINRQNMSNDNSKHSCDEVVILDDAQISTNLFNMVTGDDENHDVNLSATVQDMMVNYVMNEKDSTRIDDGNTFKNFLNTNGDQHMGDIQISDFGNFQGLENIIEAAANYYSPAKINPFDDVNNFNQQPCFCVPEDTFAEQEHPRDPIYQPPLIDGNNGEINTPTHSVRIPSPIEIEVHEKEDEDEEDTKAVGRIYVVKNLLEEPTAAATEKPRKAAKNIGRPKGARKSGITELKKIYSNITSDEIGTKCDNEDCAIRFRNLNNLSYHQKCHTNESYGIICPECKNMDFRNWNTLHTHLWREHEIDMELYSCEKCNFKTPVLSRLKNTHVKIHSDERNFKCEMCDKRFKNTKQLKNHRRIHRTAPDQQQQVRKCDLCPTTLVTERQYKKHLRTEHECTNGHTCSVCGKVMNSMAALKIHEKKHTESGQFTCTTCNYTTHDHNAARRHRMKHSKEKQYKCPFCGYKSIQSTTYRNHLMKMHPAQADELIFKCTECTFETINLTKYRLHVAKHDVREEKQQEKSLIDQINQDILEIFSDATDNVPSEKHNKIKVKSNLVLRDPSKFINTNNLLLQNLQPHQMLPTPPPADQHLPLIRPALFSKTFDGDGVKQLKLTDRLPPCSSPQYPNIDLT